MKEPKVPGPYAGVKRWARYLKQVPPVVKTVKEPELYLNTNRTEK